MNPITGEFRVLLRSWRGQYLREPKTFLFRNLLVASLVKHFRTGLVAFSIIVPFCPMLTFFIYDSQGPDLSHIDQERNRRDCTGYLMAVEDGV